MNKARAAAARVLRKPGASPEAITLAKSILATTPDRLVRMAAAVKKDPKKRG